MFNQEGNAEVPDWLEVMAGKTGVSAKLFDKLLTDLKYKSQSPLISPYRIKSFRFFICRLILISNNFAGLIL